MLFSSLVGCVDAAGDTQADVADASVTGGAALLAAAGAASAAFMQWLQGATGKDGDELQNVANTLAQEEICSVCDLRQIDESDMWGSLKLPLMPFQ